MSDGIFAFALTLLVVSLSVPQSFYEVWLTIRDFPAFAMSFAILIMCWYSHYIFFRRYGLEDFFTMFINTIILFLILFYVFPLKFLMKLLWRTMLGDNVRGLFAVPQDAAIAMLPGSQRFWLMIFYGSGIIGIFGLYLILKLHALRLRDKLELDEVEIVLTKASIHSDLIWIGVATLSIGFSFFSAPLAGMAYFLMGPAQGIMGAINGTKAERLFKEIHARIRLKVSLFIAATKTAERKSSNESRRIIESRWKSFQATRGLNTFPSAAKSPNASRGRMQNTASHSAI